MKQFSVIIPHYGTPSLLERCIKSIPQRDDVEVIIVDDKSPVFHKEVYESLYPGVKVIVLTERAGAGRARNVGLDAATGVWLTFLDADDLFDECIDDVLNEVSVRSEDLVCYRTRAVKSDDLSVPSKRNDYHSCFDAYFKNNETSALRYGLSPLWGKFVRRELVIKNDIRFDEIMYSNDVMFSVRIGYYAGSVVAVDKVAYLLTERKGSLTDSDKADMAEWQIRYDTAIAKRDFLEEHEVNYKSEGWRYVRKMRPRNRSITSLKGLLVFLVFIDHAKILPGIGGWAVTAFFILSGYCCTLGYGDALKRGSCSYGKFVWNRLCTFYPLHWLCLISALILGFLKNADVSHLWIKFAIHAALLQAWSPIKSVYYCFNGVSWFLSAMVFLSLVFPFLSTCVDKLSEDGKKRVLVLSSLAWLVLRVLSLAEVNSWLFYCCPAVRIPELLMGICIAGLFGEIKVKSRILTSNPLVWFGTISFEFFMIHWLCINTLRFLFFGILGIHSQVLLVVSSFVAAVLASVIVHKYFTVPVSQRLKR